MIKILLALLFFLTIPAYGKNLKKELISLRYSYYFQGSPVHIEKIYQLYNQIDKTPEELELGIYVSTIFAEQILYYPENNIREFDFLKILYQKYKKKAIKSHNPSILQKMSELSLLILQIQNQQSTSSTKKLKYVMDARYMLLQALKIDKNYIPAKITLGKWQAYRVIHERHFEVNHTLAQAEKFLDDRLLNDLSDDWDEIEKFQAYIYRSLLRIKTYNIESAHEDFNKAKELFPDVITKLFENISIQKGILWF